jgi:predicted DNA-binding protein YlxM (UPF0122 family)
LDALVAEESRCRLWNLAADVLTEEQWTALWLHYVEEMPTRDIASVLERSRASVKILLFRARKTLLPQLEKHDLLEKEKTFKEEFVFAENETSRRRPQIAGWELPHG